MLSKNAFNALLKTLEEPAVRRQIRVRDNRGPQGTGHGSVALPTFRLRRVPVEMLIQYYRRIAEAEESTPTPRPSR